MIFCFKHFAKNCILKYHFPFYVKMCAVDRAGSVYRAGAARYRAVFDRAGGYGST